MALLSAVSCDDFLKQKADDLIIPQNAEQYKELLQGEGYFKDLINNARFLIFMTDEVEVSVHNPTSSLEYSPFLSYYKEAYTWTGYVENDQLTDNLYAYLYRQVLVANTCIDAIETIDDSDAQKRELEGQARFTRAYAYMLLANIYAQAPNEADPDDPCVPLVLSPKPTTQRYSPATIREVWSLIASDASAAVKCLEETTISNPYEINYEAALVLAARIALYMEDFDAAISYGEQLLTQNNRLMDISESSQISSDDEGFLNLSDNPEIVWRFDIPGYSCTYRSLIGSSANKHTFCVTSELTSLYEYDESTGEGDKRLVAWFDSESSLVRPFKYNDFILGSDHCHAFRTGEVYLCLAEAYTRKETPETHKALDLLNTLRAHRISSYQMLTAGDFNSNDELVRFIWEERRRELFMEEFHRWFDLRRTGQPRLTHNWYDGQEFILPEKGTAYVIALPEYERKYNNTINE